MTERDIAAEIAEGLERLADAAERSEALDLKRLAVKLRATAEEAKHIRPMVKDPLH